MGRSNSASSTDKNCRGERCLNSEDPSMLSSSGQEGIDGDETLYRRVPVKMKWYDPVTGRLSPEAFHPNRKDESGISLDRKKYRTLEEAAQGPHMDGYYVAVLRAAELQAHGITVAAKPNAGNPGHAEIPRLNYAERRIDRCKEWQKLLCARVNRGG